MDDGATSGIRVRGLTIVAPAPGGAAPLVDGLDLDVAPGEKVGLVGASGSGKSLTALAVLGLCPAPARLVAGSVSVDGVDMLEGPPEQVRSVRGGGAALVPQDAGQALNPVLRIGDQVVEVIRTHRHIHRREARRIALELLDRTGLEPARDLSRAWPHQLSGGQQQRAMLAVALAGEPRYLVADEPTTALDVVTRRRVLDLLRDVADERCLGLLLISHDLAVVAAATRRVVVMSAGRVVERAAVGDLLGAPSHPATRQLVAAAGGAAEEV